MNINKILEKYGLTDSESSVYLCLLKYTEASAFRVAEETKIPRTSVYHTLKSLENQGLVSSWRKNNIQYFSAESPKRLIKILKDKEEMINNILSEMLNIRGTGDLIPTAKLYTGPEGMKIVWDDILETLERKNIRVLHAITHHRIFDHLPKFFPEWVKRREGLGIKTLAITTDIEENRKSNMVTNNLRETRLLPSDSPIQGTIDIYANKIAFFSTKGKEIYSIIIESDSIAEVMRQFFLSTWQLLGKEKTLEE